MQESLNRLVACGNRAEGNDHHDYDPGEILHSSIPIREALGRFPSRQRECHPQRHCGRGIGKVVDGIGKQRDATRVPDDDKLHERRNAQEDKRPLDRPDASLGGRDGRVDHTMAVIIVTVVVIVAVITPMFMLDWRAHRPKPPAQVRYLLAKLTLSSAPLNPLASFCASSFAQKCMKKSRGCSSSM